MRFLSLFSGCGLMETMDKNSRPLSEVVYANDSLFGPLDPENPSTHGKPRVSYVLNSKWVLQLQGAPPDWCDLPTEKLCAVQAMASASQSSPPSPPQST